MSVIAVIQARMGSTRLPGKSLLPLAGSTVLGLVYNTVSRNDKVDEVIVVTSTENEDDLIEEFCKENNITFFRGDSKNVLSRFMEIARKLDPLDTIVRVTADNPVNNSTASLKLFCRHFKENNDYTFVEGLSHTVYEFIKVEALLTLSSLSSLTEEDREHVTMYFRKNKDKFRINSYSGQEIGVDEDLDKLLTIDTLQDYNRFVALSQKFNLKEEVDFELLHKWVKEYSKYG